MSIFLEVLHLAFSVTFFLPFGFVNIITKAQKAFEFKYSWKEFFIMANRIMLNQTSYHGAGAIQEIANEAKAHGFKKAFVCSDPDLVKFKVTAKVTDILTANGLDYELYSDIKANPTIQNVQHGVEAFKASGADYLIAIGGGSSMDTSKAIGIIIANPEFEDVRSLEGVAPTKNRVFRSSPFRQQPVLLPKLRSTMLSPISRENVNLYALTRMTCRSLRSLTLI